MTTRRLVARTTLSLAFVLALVAALMPAGVVPALAEDGAHGSGNAAANDDTPQLSPSEAVKAPRVTETYAEKGMAPNPIAMDFDPRGNLYVVDAGRAGISVIDNRNAGLRKSNGVINDLQKTTVEDRLEQINMLEDGGFYPRGIFNKADDKIHFLQDTDGDGKADKTSIFAENFNDKLDGIASGVLYHQGKVYLTNIPHLWLLEDKDGDGDADKETEGERVSMSYGYGIRWAFYGHDMHGLIKGHDGRIYWSIGDRGYNVKTKEGKQLYGPDRGAVFRMWPDGSGLEVYHEGLRNPQELAFDNYGNLFTGDNNSDSGDKARFIYVTEGGHSGWNQDVQSLRDRGPWNREKMWHPRESYTDPLQPQWQTPPLKNVGRGPSGLAHYPGVGDVFAGNGSFLLCDYPAGVRHVQTEPKGAGFKVIDDSSFINGGTITDVAWGYDGRLYLTDWGGGWKPNPNGTVKTMVNAAAHKEQAATIAEVKARFKEGFEGADDKTLIRLLGHADQRVRLNAQWEAAGRTTTRGALVAAMTDMQKPELLRLHALWALGMRAQASSSVAPELVAGASDPSVYIRGQTASVLGDIGYRDGAQTLVTMLKDDSAIVRYHAAIALGKVGDANHVAPLLALLEANNNEDAEVRHAASYGLAMIGDSEAIHQQARSKGPAARLGAVIALRRLESPLLAEYLGDEDVLVVAEAVRGIYDKRVMAAMPVLASLVPTKEQMIEPVMRRVIEANVRLADSESAVRLAQIAENQRYPADWRLHALKELEQWSAERDREGVWGSWWPRGEQPMDEAVDAMVVYLPSVLEGADGELKTLSRSLQQQYVAKTSPEQLAKTALSADEPDVLRFGTLRLLRDADQAKAVEVAQQLTADAAASAELRMAGRDVLLGLDSEAGWASYVAALESGELLEKQDAIARLGRGKGEVSGETMIALSGKLKAGTLDPALRLDVVQAVQGNAALPIQARAAVQQYVDANAMPGEEPFIRDAVLAGGSVERGRDIFYNHEAAQCQRCHNVGGGALVGPDLAGIGTVHDAMYLYVSLVRPSADIAPGFAASSVTLKNGEVKTGRILRDKSTPAELVLADNEGKQVVIPSDQIEGVPRTDSQSQMTMMTDKLSLGELRDVLAYLGSLTGQPSETYVQAGGGGGGAAINGPTIVNGAKDLPHLLVLTGVLGGIGLALFVLLLVTMAGARPA